MTERVEVVAQIRQLYREKMVDPEESFDCDVTDVPALEAIGAIRQKAPDETTEPKKKGHYARRDMRAEK